MTFPMLFIDPDSRLAKVLMVVVVLPGATVVLWLLLGSFFRSFRSTKWPTAPGVVLVSRVEKADRNPHNLWLATSKAVIRYQYAVAGHQFESERIAFGLASESGSRGSADRKVAKFPQGQVVDVYFDPHHPEDSCLETGTLDWKDCVVLLFALLGMTLGMKILGDFLRWLFHPRVAVVN
jgi:hypothetical protein